MIVHENTVVRGEPTAVRRPLDAVAVAVMVVLCVCWGLQQVAIKVAATDVGPIAQMGLRSAVAALLAGLVLFCRPGRISRPVAIPWRQTARPGFAVGGLSAVGFLCLAGGATCTTASHLAVFLYTAPVFASLGLHRLVPEERLRAGQWVGVVVAFGGIALALFEGACPDTGGGPAVLLGDALAVVGGLCSGATTVVIRRSKLADAPPALTLLYQLGVGGAALLGAAAASGELAAVSMTGVAWASLAFQAVAVCFASYLAWYWLMGRYLASPLAALSFLTPILGVAFGVLLLGEPVGVRFAAGAAVVLTGVLLASRRGGETAARRTSGDLVRAGATGRRAPILGRPVGSPSVA